MRIRGEHETRRRSIANCRSWLAFLLVILTTVRALSEESHFIRNLRTPSVFLTENWLAYAVEERLGGADLNGDGDAEDRVVHIEELSSGLTTNLRFAVEDWRNLGGAFDSRDGVVFLVSEAAQGADLNRDGDTDDHVAHVHDTSAGETRNLRLAVGTGPYLAFAAGGSVAVGVVESDQGADLNGDGDTRDSVAHVYDTATGRTRNLGLAAGRISAAENKIVLSVREADDGDGVDLNDDGDTEDDVLHIHDCSTGQTENLELAVGWALVHTGNRILFSVREDRQGTDLNTDEDFEDEVLHVHDLSTGETTNLELALGFSFFTAFWSGDQVAFPVSETAQGADLNGDGDTEDRVAHIYTVATGETTNLSIAVGYVIARGNRVFFNTAEGCYVLDLSTGATTRLPPEVRFAQGDADWVALVIAESPRQEDLNGDDDTHDLVGFVHNLATGRSTNLRLTVNAPLTFDLRVVGRFAVLSVNERDQDDDLNGDGDRDDTAAHLVSLGLIGLAPFLRGDCNRDGEVNISDATCALDRLFAGAAPSGCLAALNANDDDKVDIADAVSLLNFLFAAGPAPAQPFPDCGPSMLPADAELGCLDPPDCQ